MSSNDGKKSKEEIFSTLDNIFMQESIHTADILLEDFLNELSDNEWRFVFMWLFFKLGVI